MDKATKLGCLICINGYVYSAYLIDRVCDV